MHDPHLLKMSSQTSDNTGQAPHFPPDVTVFGLLCRSPSGHQVSLKDKREKMENQRKSLKNCSSILSSCSGPYFHQHQRGTGSRAVGFKIR